MNFSSINDLVHATDLTSQATEADVLRVRDVWAGATQADVECARRAASGWGMFKSPLGYSAALAFGLLLIFGFAAQFEAAPNPPTSVIDLADLARRTSILPWFGALYAVFACCLVFSYRSSIQRTVLPLHRSESEFVDLVKDIQQSPLALAYRDRAVRNGRELLEIDGCIISALARMDRQQSLIDQLKTVQASGPAPTAFAGTAAAA